MNIKKPASRAGVNPFSMALKADPWSVICAIYNFLTDAGYAFTEGIHHGQHMWVLSRVREDRSLEPLLWVPYLAPGFQIEYLAVSGEDRSEIVKAFADKHPSPN